MRLFGTFKSIEVYLILTAIFLLFTFDHLCFKKEADMMTYWYPKPVVTGDTIVEPYEVDNLVKPGSRRRLPLPPLINSTQTTTVGTAAVSQKESSNATTTSTGLPATVPLSTSAAVNKNMSVIVEEQQRVVETRPDPTLLPVTTPAEALKNSPTAPPTLVVLKNETEASLSPTAPAIIVLKKEADSSPTPAVAMEVLKKEEELSPAASTTVKAMKKELSTVEGHILPQTEDLPTTPVVAADPSPPPVAIHPEAEKGFQGAYHAGVPSTELPSTLAPQPTVVTEKADEEPGFWNGWGLFGGKKAVNTRVKRMVVVPIDHSTKSIIPNETFFGAYRCERALTAFTKFNPFEEKLSVYQQLFAWRTWGIILLAVHLLMVLYHVFVNYMHRVPTSQRFNRVFAGIGLFIWDSITLWIVYQYFVWNQKFDAFVPDFPAEFYAFLVLSVAMNSILLYEFFHRNLYLSYDITPRHARNGYIPARQDENEYINGIIRQLENAPRPPSTIHMKPEAVVVHQ